MADTVGARRSSGAHQFQWHLTIWTVILEWAGIVALHAQDPDAYFHRLAQAGFRGAATRSHPFAAWVRGGSACDPGHPVAGVRADPRRAAAADA
eukprot:9151291-Alexandrium_andersonii.AAC.1